MGTRFVIVVVVVVGLDWEDFLWNGTVSTATGVVRVVGASTASVVA